MDRLHFSDSLKAVPEVNLNKRVLDNFKQEVANEIGVKIPDNGYWGNKTSRECGEVGGYMVKKLIEMAEDQLIGRR